MDIQTALPPCWIYESCRTYGVIVTAVETGRQIGSVTVNEEVRGFKLGIVPVRERGSYAGRGWKKLLYADAVKALQAALS